MKTIEEFKNAGLGFINGDCVGSNTVLRDTSTAILNSDVCCRANLDLNVTEFAWREAENNKPSFTGLIEAEFILGEPVRLHTENITNKEWLLINKWRPVLNQAIPTETPEEKEELDRMFGVASGKKICKIMDAVNTLKGDIENSVSYFGEDYLQLFEDGDYVCTHFGNDESEKGHTYICTTKEFNALISQLETNFGKSITYSEYKKIREGIDWNEAGEDDLAFCFSLIDGSNGFIGFEELPSGEESDILFEFVMKPKQVKIYEPIKVPVTQPQPNPVYTPEVGEEFTKEFAVRGGTNSPLVFQKCKVVYSGSKFTVVVNESGREFSRRTVKLIIRDVKPEIELIDGECYQFEFDGNTCKGYYQEEDKTLNWVFNHSKVADCTNIKPLVLGNN